MFLRNSGSIAFDKFYQRIVFSEIKFMNKIAWVIFKDIVWFLSKLTVIKLIQQKQLYDNVSQNLCEIRFIIY